MFIKRSKRFSPPGRIYGKLYEYWWDIVPGTVARIKKQGKVTFKKKDCGEQCVVESQTLLPFLTQERQTSRKAHSWGIRVLINHPDDIAIEPGPRGRGDWAYIPVKWNLDTKEKRVEIDSGISLETAKKLLSQTSTFCRPGKQGVSDFILPGKEALLLSMYTGTRDLGAMFIAKEGRTWRLKTAAGLYSSLDRLELLEFAGGLPNYMYSSALSTPVSQYLRLFPGWERDKHIIMVDYSKYHSSRSVTEAMMESTYDQIRSGGLEVSDCMFWPSTPDGFYGEDFWQYLSCLIFRSKGYFVTAFNLGLDFGGVSAYYIPDYLGKLQEEGIIDQGAFFEELELFNGSKPIRPETCASGQLPELTFVKAESSRDRTWNGEGACVEEVLRCVQPGNKYDAGRGSSLIPLYYTHGFMAGPYCKDTSHPHVGVISCTKQGELIFRKGEPCREPVEEGITFVKDLVKVSLLRSLSLELRTKCLGLKQPFTLDEYYERLLSVSIDDVLACLVS